MKKLIVIAVLFCNTAVLAQTADFRSSGLFHNPAEYNRHTWAAFASKSASPDNTDWESTADTLAIGTDIFGGEWGSLGLFGQFSEGIMKSPKYHSLIGNQGIYGLFGHLHLWNDWDVRGSIGLGSAKYQWFLLGEWTGKQTEADIEFGYTWGERFSIRPFTGFSYFSNTAEFEGIELADMSVPQWKIGVEGRLQATERLSFNAGFDYALALADCEMKGLPPLMSTTGLQEHTMTLSGGVDWTFCKRWTLFAGYHGEFNAKEHNLLTGIAFNW